MAKSPVPITQLQILWAICAIAGLLAVIWPAAHAPAPALFFHDVTANPSTLTISLDLIFLGLAMVIFAISESRRLGMRYPWIWVPLALPLPGAFLMPVFFLLRERAMIRLSNAR